MKDLAKRRSLCTKTELNINHYSTFLYLIYFPIKITCGVFYQCHIKKNIVDMFAGVEINLIVGKKSH